MNSSWIVGGNPEEERAENDFYATDPEALIKLFNVHKFNMSNVLEPCVGNGNLAKVITQQFPKCNLDTIDIIDRGYPCIKTDFLSYDTDKKYTSIITNPPYSLASEFIEKSLSLLDDGGQLAMFLKIQFLEGQKRKELFEKYPMKYVYVFRKRIQIFKNGIEKNPKTGKRWNTLMCSAWYIWEKNYKSEPIIRWL